MKVVILNTSDATGGAAIVSYRLMEALCRRGLDARMLVVNRTHSADERVDVAGTVEQKRWAFLGERLRIWAVNGFSKKNLFKVSTADRGVDVLSHPWVKAADVVCLNWINQGMMSLRDVARLGRMGKKIVWTMHDMWCCTGICHHAYDCTRYEDSCGNCPFLRYPYRRDLSYRTWKAKKAVLDATDIHFVAVSHWLADCCRRSSLLAGRPLSVIHNALPVEQFDWHRSPSAPAGKCVVAMGAARLDDPVKGFDLLIKATEVVAEKYPDDARRIELLLFGNIRDNNLFDQIKLSYRWLGQVGVDRIPEIYRESDVVLSTSHYETLPTTLIEGQAAGCLAVAFDHGGQTDIVRGENEGRLADYPDVDSLARCIVEASRMKADRQALHEAAVRRFSMDVVTDAYLDLFRSLGLK